MSVLIKSMTMPESCDDCRLNNGIMCYAVPEYTEDGVVGRTEDRPDWCPLVPAPPHGDLIDRDALPVSGMNNYYNGKWIEFVYADDIENAQVIIPAEEAET